MGYTHGIKWSDELICTELKEVMRILGINTMPTHSQMDEVFGSEALTNAVVHHGGTMRFAKLIGAEIKECESKFGDKYENLCAKEISDRYGFVVEKMKPRYPYDLLVDGSVKVDSKVSKLYVNNKKKISFYTFNLEKKNPTCDVFVCYCINNNDQIVKTIIIPSSAVTGQTQLSTGVSGRWDKYINNWDLIQRLAEFNRSSIK